MSTYLATPSSPGRVVSYRSKAVFMALAHTIISMVVFTLITKELIKLSFPPSLIIEQLTLYPWIVILEVVLTALFGLVIYSGANRAFLLKHPQALLKEIAATLLFQLVFIVALTLVYLSFRSPPPHNSTTFLLYLSLNPLVILDYDFVPMFLTGNILLLLTPLLTSLLSIYFLIFGLHLVHVSNQSSSPASVSRLLLLLFMLIITILSMMVFNLIFMNESNPPNPVLANQYGYVYETFTAWLELLALGMLLWFVYPAVLGEENSVKLLANRRSQLVLVLVGIFNSVVIINPIPLNFSIFSFTQISMYLVSNLLILLYHGCLFACQILVTLSLKYGMPQSQTVDPGFV